MPKGDPHSYAVAAEANLEKLATELARLGADDGTVNAVEQMAATTRKIVEVLGKGQAATGDDEPAEEEQPETIESATESMQADAQQRAKERESYS